VTRDSTIALCCILLESVWPLFKLLFTAPFPGLRSMPTHLSPSIPLFPSLTPSRTRRCAPLTRSVREDWWHQLCHTWKHYAFVVPFVWALNRNSKNTTYAAAWTLVNAHEVAIISGQVRRAMLSSLRGVPLVVVVLLSPFQFDARRVCHT
jgi:hypothetical protein